MEGLHPDQHLLDELRRYFIRRLEGLNEGEKLKELRVIARDINTIINVAAEEAIYVMTTVVQQKDQ